MGKGDGWISIEIAVRGKLYTEIWFWIPVTVGLCASGHWYGNMTNKEIINWLLDGDVSIQYQVYRDLLEEERPELRARIEKEGWGAEFLKRRLSNGHWGNKFYHPKWTSSHYTILDLRNLCISPENTIIRETIDLIAEKERATDGGIHPAGSVRFSDVCINGMFMNYAAYFGLEEKRFEEVVDFILSQKMPDGGFNCTLNRSGAVHSSLHTTISVMEGISEYEKNGYQYRLDELKKVEKTSLEFILLHHLFKSDRSGKIINEKFLRFSFPGRWYYDILRALDHFQYAGFEWDERMKAAIDVVLDKRNKDGSWNMQAKHPGQVHFEMEKAGRPGRWNTLRVLRVLKHFNIKMISE